MGSIGGNFAFGGLVGFTGFDNNNTIDIGFLYGRHTYAELPNLLISECSRVTNLSADVLCLFSHWQNNNGDSRAAAMGSGSELLKSSR
jgi:hypothetical protein